MKIPNKINIMGYEFDIIIIDDQTKIGNDGDRTECYGAINWEDQTIKIWSKISTYKQFVTLLHETMHGIYEFTAINKKDKYEEADIILMSHLVADTLMRNGIVK